MFSSLASYLFGSNNSATTTNSEATTAIGSGVEDIGDTVNTVDAENLIEVTSLTPSVTGAGDRSVTAAEQAATRAIRRGKNWRNNNRQQSKRKESKSTKQVTKLSSPSDNCDEDFDEDEWYIVEKEDDEGNDVSSPSRNDSEGDNTGTIIEIVKSVKPTIAPSSLAQQRRLQHITSHSLYSGPRPQKQRNYLQKPRGNNANNKSRNSGLSVSTLSPSRTVKEGRKAGGNGATGVTADGGMTRSLYVAPPASPQQEAVLKPVTAVNGTDVVIVNAKKMDESCMSVYRSIKRAQETNERFVKLDLEVVKETKEKRPAKENVPRKQNSQGVQQRSSAGFRLDRQSVAQLKQELLARTVQMTQSKRERMDIRRSAIKRANKVREVQSRNHTSRRSDRQHCKIVSGANNNRKSCF